MAKIYVANVSLHDQLLQYRLPGEKNLRSQMLALRNQVQLSGDLQPEEVEAFVEQMGPYGLVEASHVGQARKMMTMLYKQGSPVSVAQQRQALERNLQILDEQGREQRANFARGVDDIMAQYNPNKHRGTVVTIEQDLKGSSTERVVDENLVLSKTNRANFIERATSGRPAAERVTRRSRRSSLGLN